MRAIVSSREKRERRVMMTLLVTAKAMEDTVLDAMNMAEDAALRTTRLFAEAFEPVTRLMPTLPTSALLPAPAEVVDHGFDFIDRLTANQRDFTNRLLEVLPINFETSMPKMAKASSKAQAA
jgi:hypothetical protein